MPKKKKAPKPFLPIHPCMESLLKWAKDQRPIRHVFGKKNENKISRHLTRIDKRFACHVRELDSNPSKIDRDGLELSQITEQYLSALDDFRRSCEGRSIEIDIGAGDSIIYWIVSPALQRLLNRKFDFYIQEGGLEGLVIQLSNGTIDFAILPAIASLKYGWQSESIGTYEYCAVCSKEILHDKELTEKDLNSLPIALSTDHWGLDFAGRAERRGIKLNVKFQCQSVAQVESLVRHGAAAGFLPLSAARSLSTICVFDKFGFLNDTNRQINLVWKKSDLYKKPYIKEIAPDLLKQLRIILKEQQKWPDEQPQRLNA